MKLSRVKRLLKIRSFELKEVQHQYAKVVTELTSLETEIEKMQSYRHKLQNELSGLLSRQNTKADQIKDVYKFIASVDKTIFSLERRKDDLLSYLERLRVVMLERKKEKDIVEKIKSKVELELFKELLDKERKEADEKATQQFIQNQ